MNNSRSFSYFFYFMRDDDDDVYGAITQKWMWRGGGEREDEVARSCKCQRDHLLNKTTLSPPRTHEIEPLSLYHISHSNRAECDEDLWHDSLIYLHSQIFHRIRVCCERERERARVRKVKNLWSSRAENDKISFSRACLSPWDVELWLSN